MATSPYWVTVIVNTFELITLLPLVYCAKTVVEPGVPPDSTHIGSEPFATVTSFAVPVIQVTLDVTSMPVCPPAVARAVKQSLFIAVVFTGMLKDVIPFGPRTILVTLASVTVAVVVALAVPEAAVMVLVPAVTPVNVPPVLIVATLGVALDQHTVVPVQVVPPVRVSGFPLLSVPAAVSCAVNPTLTDGLGGSIAMVDTVGFTKKPVQLMARANVATAAKAPARRSLCLVDDIVISGPLFASASTFSARMIPS